MPINGDFVRLKFMPDFFSHSQRMTLFSLLLLFLTNVSYAQVGIKISEILFNPPSDGADYLELYNDSDSSVSLRDIRLAQ